MVSAPVGVGIAAIAFVAIVACAVRARKEVRPFTLVWSGVFAAFSLFFGVWSMRGLCDMPLLPFAITQAAFAAAGILVLRRDYLAGQVAQCEDTRHTPDRSFADWRIPGRKGRVQPWMRDVFFLVTGALFAFLALETADNPEWMAIPVPYLVLAYILILAAMAALYFLLQRRGIGPVLVAIVCMGFGAAQNFLDLFKNTALLPSDVLAWQTAASVSGGYTFSIDEKLALALACGAVALGLLAFIVPVRSAHAGQHRVKRFFVNLLCFALLGGGLAGVYALVDFQGAFDIRMNYWDLRNAYHSRTFTLAFTAAAQDLRVQKPEGYSDDAARDLQEKLAAQYDAKRGADRGKARAQFDKAQPNVIAIMNETYSDLSAYEQLHDGYDGVFVTRDLKDALVSGKTNMSVFGGGTCNSEYEFLAGSSLAFLGRGMYPYQQFGLGKLDALPKQFRELGYHTTAIHPNYPGNWNREFVYAQMGFDESYFIYDFDGAAQFHGDVADSATYDRALQTLRETDGPAFVLDVTMQNHGGYDTGIIDAADLTDIQPDFGDADATAQLNEYLSCIAASDRDLKALLDQLEDFDEPVAVVFFGDHQPSIARDVNDAVFSGEDELVHAARIMQTPYFVWTNYDVAGNTSENGLESSANYLAAQFLEAIGAPLSDYQKALLVLHDAVRAVNVNGYEDPAGVWHAPDEEADSAPLVREAYDQLRILHYYNVVRKL